MLPGCAAIGSTTAVPTPTATAAPTAALSSTATVVVATRTVTFVTQDGVKLAGTLYGSGHTALVLSNQTDTTQRDWAPFAKLAASKGYLALAYDFRGQGASQGSFDTDELSTDVRAAMAFVRQQGARHIALIGASIGGAATARAAAAEHVNAVVILSAPAAWPDLEVTDGVIKHLGAPAFFLNSEGDTYASAIQHMYEVAAQPKQLKLYKGVDHGVELVYDPEIGTEVRQLIIAFLATYAPASA
jgi:alpha/beta superfamily hydrolase